MAAANRDPSELHPHVRAMLQVILTEMAARGKEVFLVEGFRSFERQNELLAQIPPTTTVPGGRSWHNYGLAIDLAFKGTSPFAATNPWSMLGEVGKEAGFDEWGGDWEEFPDRPHLEWHGTFNDIAQPLAIRNANRAADWRTKVWVAAGEMPVDGMAVPAGGSPVAPEPVEQRPTLRLATPRMRGEAVITLQQRLRDLGFNEVGTVDGFFGPLSERAVKAFQQRNGLPATGVVGPTVWARLLADDALTALPEEPDVDGQAIVAQFNTNREAGQAALRYGANEADDFFFFSQQPHRDAIAVRHRHMRTSTVRLFIFDKGTPDPRQDLAGAFNYVQAALDIPALPHITFARIPGVDGFGDGGAVPAFAAMCGDFVAACVGHFGGAQVAGWSWGIWNEPNNAEVNSGHPLNFDQYREVYRAVAPRIAAPLQPFLAGRRPRIGGPAVDGFDGQWKDVWIGRFIHEIADDPQTRNLTDYVSWHRFGSFRNPLDEDPALLMDVTRDYGQRAADVKALIGDRPLANLCEELNASSLSGDRFNNTHFNVAYYASVLVNLIRGGADGELFWEATNDAGAFGAMNRDGVPKPVLLGKALFANCISAEAGSKVHIPTNTTGDPNVEAVACRRGNDQRLVLVHKASGPATYTVRGVSGAASLLKIDQGTGLAVHRLPFDGTVTFDGYGVAAVINGEPASTGWWEDRR